MYMMMMIAFITIKSGLVPLIEVLCAQILYFRFAIIGGLRSHLLLFFFGRKHMFKQKAVSPRSHPASAYTYTRVLCTHILILCTHIRIYVCQDLVHLDSSGPPGVST